METKKHEFSAEQEKSIDRIRITLSHISILLFGIGFLLLLIGHKLPMLSAWVTIIAAGFFFVLGVVYYHPLTGFMRVIRTSRDDINHMMVALDNLQVAFSIATWIVLVLSGLVLCMILILLM
jgi:hypothetical protein